MKLFLQKTLVVMLAVIITSLFVKGVIQVGDTTITNESSINYKAYIPIELEDYLLTNFELGVEIFYIEGVYNSYYEINFGTNGPITRPLTDMGTVAFDSAIIGNRNSSIETDPNVPLPAEVWTIDAFRIVSNVLSYSSVQSNLFTTVINFGTSTSTDFYVRFYGISNYGGQS